MILNMRMRIGKDENEWVKQAWTWIHDEISPGQSVFVPAGGTPTPLYRRWMQEPTSLLRGLRLLQLDEIISGERKGEFRAFFQRELPAYLPQFEWISTAESVADVAILGVGVNGHVAFHEPGLPRDFAGGCVRLSQETLSYLDLPDPTWGLTYGVATFMRAKKILVLARGANKKAVIEQATREKNLPISWILEHHDVTLVTDF